MSQIHGQKIISGSTTRWHPISVEEIVPGEYALKVSGTFAPATGAAIPKHYNNTANLIKSTITFAGTTEHIQVENMDGVKNLFISFDAGVNWRTIQPGYILDLDCTVLNMDIKASADGCLCEILTTE